MFATWQADHGSDIVQASSRAVEDPTILWNVCLAMVQSLCDHFGVLLNSAATWERLLLSESCAY